MTLLKRPWVWVIAVIVAGILVSSCNYFPAGEYQCAWIGASPTGKLAGDLVVEVGRWPNTYPLDARINTATGPVALEGWTFGHGGYSRQFAATIPIRGERFEALCKLE